MKDFYVFQNWKIEADEKLLVVIGEEKRRLPISEIAGLHLLAGYTITSGAIDLLAQNNIPIHVYNFHGVYRGSFFPPPVEPTGSILINQVKSRLSEERRFKIAFSILRTSNQNAKSLLDGLGIELNTEINGSTVEDLILSEARFRKEYYAQLDTVLPPFWSIVKRERYPPRKPADAVLGFANGILYAKMSGWIHRAGLDPRISYIHGIMRARNPLSLDLAEILKPILSESVLLEVASEGLERSIVTKVGKGVYLNEKGRKLVIKKIEEKLKKRIKPYNADRGDIIEIWGATIPRKLHRALIEEKDPWLPVIPCTLSSSTMQILMSGRLSVPY